MGKVTQLFGGHKCNMNRVWTETEARLSMDEGSYISVTVKYRACTICGEVKMWEDLPPA